MQNGSNCALVHEYKPNLQVGCIQNRITVIMCKWHVSNTLYRMYTRMAIKSV